MKSSFVIAQPNIVAFFDASEKKIYKRREMQDIFLEERDEWELATSMRFNRFIKWIVDKTELRMIRLAFETRPEIRYTWGKVSIYDLALSLKSEAYLSHQTASYLHGLTDFQPNNVYVNSE